jgi:hypothetical protein
LAIETAEELEVPGGLCESGRSFNRTDDLINRSDDLALHIGEQQMDIMGCVNSLRAEPGGDNWHSSSHGFEDESSAARNPERHDYSGRRHIKIGASWKCLIG